MSETTTPQGESFRAERTEDEVVLRFPTLNRLLRSMLPDDAVKHMYAAQREQLLALRSIIDAAVKRIESAEAEGGATRPRRTEIRIE